MYRINGRDSKLFLGRDSDVSEKLFTHKTVKTLFFNELEVEDPAEFRMLLRMDVLHFEKLLENITPLIQKEHTVIREAISAKTKLQVVLSYFITGTSFRYSQDFYLGLQYHHSYRK